MSPSRCRTALLVAFSAHKRGPTIGSFFAPLRRAKFVVNGLYCTRTDIWPVVRKMTGTNLASPTMVVGALGAQIWPYTMLKKLLATFLGSIKTATLLNASIAQEL